MKLNAILTIGFIGTSFATVWHMRYHKVVKQTYNKDQDTFRHYYLILLSLGLALLIPRAFTVIEVLWAFSIYLEAVAILPQLVLLQRSRNIDNLLEITFSFSVLIVLYILSTGFTVSSLTSTEFAGYTALYADFFYYYIKSWKEHEELKLPA
ncbi:hypothetical protein TB2_042260 [Malus domestica]